MEFVRQKSQAEIVTLLWTATSYIVIVSLTTYVADYNHYTWVNIGAWGAYSLASVLGLGPLLFFFFMSMQSQVILGVILLSLSNCYVFTHTYETVGPLIYIIGNFFMHFLAPLEATMLVDRSKLVTDPTYISTSIWLGYGVLAAWDYWHDPWNVYGCTGLSTQFSTLAPFVLAFLETVITPVFFTTHLYGP
jgi:hypothetical protein